MNLKHCFAIDLSNLLYPSTLAEIRGEGKKIFAFKKPPWYKRIFKKKYILYIGYVNYNGIEYNDVYTHVWYGKKELPNSKSFEKYLNSHSIRWITIDGDFSGEWTDWDDKTDILSEKGK